MRYTGWARVTFIGDVLAGQQLIPLARVVLGEVINRLDLQRESVRSIRRQAWEAIGQKPPQAFARPVGSTRKTYADGTLIEAGWDGTTAWMRITTTSENPPTTLEGFGFILSPFNGSVPTIVSPPLYESTLLLINGNAYAHDYPDTDHHWFVVDGNGNYTALGNEFTGNPLLQGNLHWRSKADPTFHLSWLGNPSDPIPYFKIGFQDGYDSGEAPYAVRLSPSTAAPAQSGSVYNFDTTQVFSVWLADMFGGLHNLQNGTGIGQVICYKGHVVKPVYDLLKPGSPITVRNCIIGVGATVDAKTKKRTLYFVVRAFRDQLPVPSDVLTEIVYSLDIDNLTAVPVQIGTRTINMTGSYNTVITVDPIPLHGYYWDETKFTFVCLAVKARTVVGNDTHNEPAFQVQSVFSTTGKATWTITPATSTAMGAANFDFDQSLDMGNAITTQPVFKSVGAFDLVTVIGVGGTETDIIPNSVFDQTFSYALKGAVIAITAKNNITTDVVASTIQHIEVHDTEQVPGTALFQMSESASTFTTKFSQQIHIGEKTFDVAELELTSNESDITSQDITFTLVSEALNNSETMTYTGKSFLWFNDTDSVYAYLEYQLQWKRTVTNNYGPISIFSSPPVAVQTLSLISYQGRYVVDNPVATQTGDWFDLTAGGQIGNTPSETNFFAFMSKLPIRLNPGAGNDGSFTIISDTGASQIFEKDYGSTLPLFELVNIISFSYFNIPNWQPSSSFFTNVAGRRLEASETDGTYSFQAVHPGGWALNGNRLCFSQIGPKVLNTLGNPVTQKPFQFLTKGDLDVLAGATGDDRGYYPLCYLAAKEIKALGQS